MLEQSRQMYTPNVTLDQLGLRAEQSKHSWWGIKNQASRKKSLKRGENSVNGMSFSTDLWESLALLAFWALRALKTWLVSAFVGSAIVVEFENGFLWLR